MLVVLVQPALSCSASTSTMNRQATAQLRASWGLCGLSAIAREGRLEEERRVENILMVERSK